MSFRVTSQTTWSLLSADMSIASRRSQEATMDAASGKKVRAMSDAPTEASNVLRLDEQAGALEEYARQASDAKAWLSTADTALMSVSTVIGQALGTVKAASSGALAQAGRDALADEIEALSAHLFELASAKYLGQPVFGGFGQEAVARDPGTGDVTWAGQTGQVLRQVAPTVTIPVNVDGEFAFGFSAGDDIFTVLKDAAAAARSGDLTAVAAASTRLTARQDDALTALHRVGAFTNRVESAADRSDSMKLAIASARSDIVDVDIAEAAMNLQLAEDGYNAVLAAIARTSRLPSLAELLR